ncbi:acyltransferase [Croceibacter atlanticus]|uniref:Acetyltransferase n=1 Tax=Croceibacter atlanticus (strain ATCC BAA-628 / JCM 21780 / CIP 108009 / IAM 15332 / KCTC 12090 / HTCC2559) TaxID=216432 RepID=A3UAX6_CROAH|nr:acyltransferase [Croceibacter atlanticus]EAP86962.1 hypothetical protein CA2559_13018 [Croceibacter atlanticus HTCC2559]
MIKIINFLKKKILSHENYAKSLGVKIGANCNIQNVSFGSEPYLIEIGNHVQITNGTKIFTHGGAWPLRKKYPDLDFFGKVTLKNNIYVGNNCLIMPGVTIESNVIIASGSVVTKSVKENSIVAGNPAKVIGNLKEFEIKVLPYNLKSKQLDYNSKKKHLLEQNENRFIKK